MQLSDQPSVSRADARPGLITPQAWGCCTGWMACPVVMVSWGAAYEIARREAETSLMRQRWARSWEPSAN